MRQSRLLVAAVAVLVVASYTVADLLDVAPGALTLDARSSAVRPRPVPRHPPRLPAEPVLPALSEQAPAPSAAGVARALAPLLRDPALGPAASATVIDATSGNLLFDQNGDQLRVPASTTKVLTAAAALTTVGGTTRLGTRVVQGAGPEEIVLVGGGDILLGTGVSRPIGVAEHAGLGTLAAQVAQALTATGRTQVVVRFDDSLFEGAAVSPDWDPTDVTHGYVGRITPLALARHRARPGRAGPVDPSAATATAFAAALSKHGITVSGAVARTRAVADAALLGQVESASVAELAAFALTYSDNTMAEVLARLTATALGRPATFQDAALAVTDQVQRLGVDIRQARLIDGSGLASGSRIPARVLADVLAVATGEREPRLRPLLSGLPVAGLSGTLTARYATPPLKSSAGLVRAKTGTLTGVNSLAGTTVDAEGRLLVFAVMADRVPIGATQGSRRAVDRIASALTGCGCR